jgi:predicted ATP-grasp superfamily ATP-dependent carboligase
VKILVSEYVLSVYQSRYLDLLPEAYAMAITLARSLSTAGCEAYLTVSSRAPKVPWNKVVVVGDEGDFHRCLERARESFDWVVLVAPPMELIRLSKIVSSSLLGPPHPLVETFSDKFSTFLALKRCGVKTPETVLVKGPVIDRACVSELNPPYVVKPALLAGSECVYFAEDEGDAVRLAREAAKCDPSGRALVQEYVSGVHGSVSVIYGRSGYLLYSLNLQLIALDGSRLRYVGGVLPIRSSTFRGEAEAALSKLFECHPTLRGYIGLDVVWSGGGMHVIEVNPRATTSIVGIYEVFPRLGEFLVSSVSGHQELGKPCFLGEVVSDYAYYLVLDRAVPALTNERSINVEGSTRTILIGRARAGDSILDRVAMLLPATRMVYDLTHVL